MALPPTSYGYPGSINSAALAKWIKEVGAARFSVAGENDWKVSSLTGLDRGIRIEAGTGSGDGVMDVFPEYDTRSLPASAGTASVWHMLVARRNWSNPATTIFTLIEGTSEKKLPVRSDDPGVESDQPVALIRVKGGESTVQEVIDLRCWAGNGGLVAVDLLALEYLGEPGACVHIGETEYRYRPGENDVFDWHARHPAQGDVFTIPIGNGETLGSVQVTFPTPFPSLPSVTATKATTSGPLSSLRRLQPLIRDVSTTGFTAFIETVDGEGVGASFNVTCRYTAVQAG